MPVSKIYYIISHFFIGMSRFHGNNNIGFKPGRKYHFNLYFLFLVLLAHLADIWICPFPTFKSPGSFCIETAFAIITDISATPIENRIPYLLCFINRRKTEKFF